MTDMVDKLKKQIVFVYDERQFDDKFSLMAHLVFRDTFKKLEANFQKNNVEETVTQAINDLKESLALWKTL